MQIWDCTHHGRTRRGHHAWGEWGEVLVCVLVCVLVLVVVLVELKSQRADGSSPHVSSTLYCQKSGTQVLAD